MPNYSYKSVAKDSTCEECGGEGFTILQQISEDPLTTCPACEQPIRKALRATVNMVKGRKTQKKMMSDGNLKRLGFKKLVKESDGNYVDVLQD